MSNAVITPAYNSPVVNYGTLVASTISGANRLRSTGTPINAEAPAPGACAVQVACVAWTGLRTFAATADASGRITVQDGETQKAFTRRGDGTLRCGPGAVVVAVQ